MKIKFPPMIEDNERKVEIDGEKLLSCILKDELGDTFDYIFDDNSPYGYIQLFLNGKQINKINAIYVSNEDSMEIISAISGG